MKRHSHAEKRAAWSQARDLIARGQSQSEICTALGISVMTFHRWRKELGDPSGRPANGSALPEEGDAENQIAALREENQRLRKIVTDLLLEKAKVEEAIRQRNLKPSHR
jgi:putative transposase